MAKLRRYPVEAGGMTPSVQIILSGSLTFGVPLLLAVRELVALRRANGGAGGFDGPRDDSPVSPPPGCEPRTPSLPACLVEAARTDAVAGQADRGRVLESA